MDPNKLICRIEGHGSINIDLSQNKAKLAIDEGERLFEALVCGRDYKEAPFIASRICGVCPTAHAIASIKALETSLGISVTTTTVTLRRLLLYAQLIQSHILHLFFLALPDYTGSQSAADLVVQYPSLYHLVLAIKKVTDELLETISGRIVHPITPTIGGFLATPDKQRLTGLLLDFEMVLDKAEELIRVFSRLDYPELNFSPLQFVLAQGDGYDLYQGKVISNSQLNFDPFDYRKFISEEVRYDSSAKYSKISGSGFMVGAFPRINLLGQFLSPRVKQVIKKSGFQLPLVNPFHNNFAQSIEVLHFLEKIVDELYILSKSDDNWDNEDVKQPQVQTGCGASAIEAPRGTLYYWFKVKGGYVESCDIITPTAQNLTCIEAAANKLLSEHKDKSPDRKQKLLEMLVRAFDPCITCSVH